MKLFKNLIDLMKDLKILLTKMNLLIKIILTLIAKQLKTKKNFFKENKITKIIKMK